MSEIPPGGLPQHRKLVERCRAWAEVESEEARDAEWRALSMQERGARMAQLLNLASFAARNRTRQPTEPALTFPRFSTRREHRS